MSRCGFLLTPRRMKETAPEYWAGRVSESKSTNEGSTYGGKSVSGGYMRACYRYP